MPTPIRFASINIEGHTHINRVVPFLTDYRPDVVCFQELSEVDILTLEKALGMKCIFVPMAIHLAVPKDPNSAIGKTGLGIFSRQEKLSSRARWYVGSEDVLPRFARATPRNLINCLVLSAEFSFGGISYTFATTHFTWTPDGNPNDAQREDLKKMLAILHKMSDFVFTGDFNAPRGMEIFDALAAEYKDNVPLAYLSSLDPELHILKNSKKLMVDGLFTTPEYIATDVKLVSGVSDHMAITALISKF